MSGFLLAAGLGFAAARMQAGVILDAFIYPSGPVQTINLAWDGTRFTDGYWHVTHINASPALIPGVTPGYRGEYVPAQEEGWVLGRTGFSAGGWLAGPTPFGTYIGANLGNAPHRVR